jgi:hypothetical protein
MLLSALSLRLLPVFAIWNCCRLVLLVVLSLFASRLLVVVVLIVSVCLSLRCVRVLPQRAKMRLWYIVLCPYLLSKSLVFIRQRHHLIDGYLDALPVLLHL